MTNRPLPSKAGITGSFPLLRFRRPINFEIGLECDFLILVDYQPDITQIETPQEGVPYRYEGKDKTYFPSYYLIQGGRKFMVEVIPSARSKTAEASYKYDQAYQWYAERNTNFGLITELDIHSGCFFKNCLELRRQALYPESIERIGHVLHDIQLGSSQYNPHLIYRTTLGLAFYHRVELQSVETQPIGPKTIVCLPGQRQLEE